MKPFLAGIAAFLICAYTHAQNFKVTLQAPQYKSGITYLTYRMGKSFNVEDSTVMNNKGMAVFTGKRKLPGGIYTIFLPGKSKLIDFLIDKEQVISVKLTDSTDLLNKTTVTGSSENILFDQYQKFAAKLSAPMEAERKAFMASTTKADSTQHEKKFNEYNKQLNDYRENLVKKNPKSMMAALLNAMRDPKVLNNKMVTKADSLENYYYYRKHYWDDITFMDERIIRTPFFLPKLEKFYREVMVPDADSIIREADYQLLLARSCPEMYKFLLNWLTDEYFNPKYMGQDAVFVHLFEKYHSKGVSNWLNEKQIETVSRRAYMLMANLIGSPAANLEMLDPNDKPASLYNLQADYTVVVFWDPNCGHCKEEIPRLDSIYQASWKAHNVKIFAMLSADSKEDVKKEWIKYIAEHKLQDWTNVYQTKEMEDAIVAAEKPGFRQLYDVTMTPTIYLLDKEKRIIGKKLTWKQMDDLLNVKWNKTN